MAHSVGDAMVVGTAITNHPLKVIPKNGLLPVLFVEAVKPIPKDAIDNVV